MKILLLLFKAIAPIRFNVMAALANGIFGLAELGANYGVQKEFNEASRKWAEKMRDYDNWYNSPEQQIQRLKDAGLNPAMLMQNPTAGGTAASMPNPANYGKLPKIELAKIGNSIVEGLLQDQQLQGLKEDLKGKQLANEAQEIANDKARHERDNGFWNISLDKSKQELENLKAVGDKYKADMMFAKNDEQRKQAQHDAKMEAHRIYKNSQALEHELRVYRLHLDKLRIDNAQAYEETRHKLLKYGVDLNKPPQNFAELEQVVDLMLKSQQLQHLKHTDRIAEIKRTLIPMRSMPVVKDVVESIIDYLDDKPSWEIPIPDKKDYEKVK